MALAVILLTATRLMVRGFVDLFNKPQQELESRSLLTLRLALSKRRYSDQLRRGSFYSAVLHKIRGLPKVESLGLVSYLPMSGDWDTVSFCIEGRAPTRLAGRLSADLESVSPDYFATLRIPLEMGRVFGSGDGADTTPVAIISKSLAQRFWPGQSALGHRLKVGPCRSEDTWRTIVGVVGDVRQFALDREPRRTIYVPYLQLARRA